MELVIHVERGMPLYRKSTIGDILEQGDRKNGAWREQQVYENITNPLITGAFHKIRIIKIII
jgi:hypothetical protein